MYKFSRYYLVLMPFFYHAPLGSRPMRKPCAQRPFLSCCSATPLLSFVVTQDVLSWRSVQVAACQSLLNKGISPRKISAGFCLGCLALFPIFFRSPVRNIASERVMFPGGLKSLPLSLIPATSFPNSTVLQALRS